MFPYALKTIQGNKQNITIAWYNDVLSKIDYTVYKINPSF
ncbi:hypothetical protein [Flavobacterium sp.]